ncbi:MAG: hypothetical protein HQL53_10740 [Magnetococcales bacterium]|nr:hypothetical protein [Magnetococcales bacterium]
MLKCSRTLITLLAVGVLALQGCSSVNTSAARSAAVSAQTTAEDALTELKTLDAAAANKADARMKAFSNIIASENAKLSKMSGSMAHFAKNASSVIKKRRARFKQKAKSEAKKTSQMFNTVTAEW